MKRAIKIDVEKQELSYVEVGEYTDIYKHVECELFCVPVTFENMDALYCDDEARLKEEIKGGFKLKGWNYPIYGNGLILGTDLKGESIDCKTTLEEIEAQIRWIYFS